MYIENMSLNGITKYNMNKRQYLDAIGGVLGLLKIGEEDGSQLRELILERQEALSDFLGSSIPAGCFYEDPFFNRNDQFITLIKSVACGVFPVWMCQ